MADGYDTWMHVISAYGHDIRVSGVKHTVLVEQLEKLQSTQIITYLYEISFHLVWNKDIVLAKTPPGARSIFSIQYNVKQICLEVAVETGHTDPYVERWLDEPVNQCSLCNTIPAIHHSQQPW